MSSNRYFNSASVSVKCSAIHVPVSLLVIFLPVTCAALPAGTITRGASVTIVHQSAAVTPFAIGVALPGPCTVVPGIANSLLLGAGLEILTLSVTSAPPFRALQCDQGLAILEITVPNTLPVGLQLRVQSLGWSIQGVPGFGPALDVTVQ